MSVHIFISYLSGFEDTQDVSCIRYYKFLSIFNGLKKKKCSK